MGDKDFPTFDSSREDETPLLLPEEHGGTETIDLSNLLTKDVTRSGSFDIRGDIWASTFGKLTQALPIPALLIDRSYNIIVANQACGRISSEYENILDTPFSGLFPDPSVARMVQALAEKVFLTRKPAVGTGTIGIGEGRISARITLRSIRIMEKRLLLVLVEDLTPEKKQLALKQKLNEELQWEITQREQAERQLAESEEKYRQFVETASDIIYQTDSEGFFTLVNPIGLRIVGYSGEELSGTNYLDLIAPEHRGTVERFYGIQFAKRQPLTYKEFPIVTKQGETVWLGQNVQLLFKDDTVVGFQAIARDITDRKRAEEALRESETRYKDLFDHAADGIYTHDLQGNYTSVNEAAARMLGYSREELLSLNYKDFVDPEYLSVTEENFRRKIQNGLETTGPYEILVHSKDGKPLWLEVTSRIIMKDEKPLGVHGTARDITERKRLEERLRHAAKMEAMGTLAGGLAHDFNNLLQIVLGYADLIAVGKEKQDKDYHRARLIYGAAMRGKDLVNRILTFSRRVETKPRPIDLNQELKQVKRLLGRTIPKMIEIELRLADNLRPINADPTQIEQILLNLAVNAAHAMPEGGKLVFETKDVRLEQDYCRTHMETKPGEYVLLTVSDTGHGMEKEILDRVFEPFFTTKERGEGTGLGLSMVFGIVKSHGGHISCHSKPGAGTAFKIYFPATDVEIPWDPASTLENPSFGTETILLADDEKSIRDLGEEILTAVGYKVLTASTGREALEMFVKAQDEVSLVILDLVMPQMGGKQCLEELLKINPNLKVLISTGYSAGGSAEEKLVSGARGFIGKPYNSKQLLRAVRHTLDLD
jgi:two-component system, cell cycle sensor histidine kinase and response regulator CckA